MTEPAYAYSRRRRRMSEVHAALGRARPRGTTRGCSITSTTLEQQHDASTFGMWVFLVTEVLFFGGLFIGLHRLPDLVSGPFAACQPPPRASRSARFNTAVLIGSSLTMAWRVRAAAARASARRAVMWLDPDDGPGCRLPRRQGDRVRATSSTHHLVPGANFHSKAPRTAQDSRRSSSRSTSP